MICKNCGAKISDSAKFCPVCGAPVANYTKQSQKSNSAAASSGSMGKGRMSPSRGSIVLIIAAVLLIIVTFFIIMFSNGSTKIQLKDYVEITTSGFDGLGTARAIFNDADFINDYSGKINWTNAGKEIYGEDSFFTSDAARVLAYEFDGYLDQSSDLSNGDVITYIWYFDESEIESSFKVKLDYENFEYTVSGLEQTQTYDAFENITLTYDGISPYLSASISLQDEVLPDYSYSLSQSVNLALGDTITVTIDSYEAQELLNSSGIYPEELSKTYTVEDVPFYVTKANEISDSVLSDMQSQAEDAYYSDGAKWSSSEKLSNVSFLGAYLLVPKSGFDTSYENKLYLIYSMNATTEDQTFTYYSFTEFTNIYCTADGSCSVDLTSYYTPEDKYYPEDLSGYYYYGYENLDDVFSACVTANLGDYTYETLSVD